jgi:hypothetical protein
MERNDKYEIISKCSSVSRPGLYVMVFLIFINSCDNNAKLINLQKSVDELKSIVQRTEEVSLSTQDN